MLNIPPFILPTSLNDLSDVQLRTLLEELRTRRLQAAAAYEASKVRATAETAVKLQKLYAKQSDILMKDLTRCDTLLSRIEGRVNKLAAIRLELEQSE